MLSAQGTVSEQGKFEQLLKSNGYVAGLAARHIEEAEDAPKEEPAPGKVNLDNDTARRNAEADLERPIGNWAVYNYYFASAGWRKFVIAWLGRGK